MSRYLLAFNENKDFQYAFEFVKDCTHPEKDPKNVPSMHDLCYTCALLLLMPTESLKKTYHELKKQEDMTLYKLVGEICDRYDVNSYHVEARLALLRDFRI